MDFLLLAAGEFVQAHGGFVGQVDPFEVFPGPGPGPVFIQAFESAEVDHDVQDGFLFVEASFLREVSEACPVAGVKGFPSDVEGPGGGLVDAQQRPQGCGLPGPVAAEEPERFPGPDIEGEVFDDRCVPEVHSEIFDVYQRLCGRVPQRHAHYSNRTPHGGALTETRPGERRKLSVNGISGVLVLSGDRLAGRWPVQRRR
ncbi:hypothetical protein D9M72_382760 [compost metagenome]